MPSLITIIVTRRMPSQVWHNPHPVLLPAPTPNPSFLLTHPTVQHRGRTQAGLVCGSLCGGRPDAALWAAQGHSCVLVFCRAGSAFDGWSLRFGVSGLISVCLFCAALGSAFDDVWSLWIGKMLVL